MSCSITTASKNIRHRAGLVQASNNKDHPGAGDSIDMQANAGA